MQWVSDGVSFKTGIGRIWADLPWEKVGLGGPGRVCAARILSFNTVRTYFGAAGRVLPAITGFRGGNGAEEMKRFCVLW